MPTVIDQRVDSILVRLSHVILSSTSQTAPMVSLTTTSLEPDSCTLQTERARTPSRRRRPRTQNPCGLLRFASNDAGIEDLMDVLCSFDVKEM
jgi:hypothetical protein